MSISADLDNDLYETLLRCGPFNSDGALRAAFTDMRINHWQSRIPHAESPRERVKKTVAYLSEQFDNRNRNVLVLLLHILADQTNSNDACHQKLKDLADEVEKTLIPKKYFIKRQDFDTILEELSIRRLVGVKGKSGSGKSTLALQIASHFQSTGKLNEHTLEFIVWISYDQTGNTLWNVLSTIANEIGRPAITKHPLDTQKDLIRDMLRKHPILLVIDDFDKMEEAVRIFINEIPPNCHVFFTGSEDKDILESYPAHPLSSLSEDETKALITAECRRLNQEDLLTTTQIDNVCQKTERLPSIIVRTITRIAALKTIDDHKIETVLSALRKEQSESIEEQFSQLKPNAKAILIVLSLFPTGTGKAALSQVADMSERECESALKQLHNLLLVKCEDEVYISVMEIPDEDTRKTEHETGIDAGDERHGEKENEIERLKDEFYNRWLAYLLDAFERCAVYADFLAEDPAGDTVKPNSLRLAVTLAEAWKQRNRSKPNQRILVLGIADRLCTYLYLIGQVGYSTEIANQAMKQAAEWDDHDPGLPEKNVRIVKSSVTSKSNWDYAMPGAIEHNTP